MAAALLHDFDSCIGIEVSCCACGCACSCFTGVGWFGCGVGRYLRSLKGCTAPHSSFWRFGTRKYVTDVVVTYLSRTRVGGSLRLLPRVYLVLFVFQISPELPPAKQKTGVPFCVWNQFGSPECNHVTIACVCMFSY